MPYPGTAALILAGGRSSRMGQSKAALPLGRVTLLSYLLGLLPSHLVQVLLLLAPGQDLPDAVSCFPPPEILRDQKIHAGPLAALAQAVDALHPKADQIFCLAVDQPFLQKDWLEGFLQPLPQGCQVRCTSYQEVPNPLLALYQRPALQRAKVLHQAGEERLQLLVRGQNPEIWRWEDSFPQPQDINQEEGYRAALLHFGFGQAQDPPIRISCHPTAALPLVLPLHAANLGQAWQLLQRVTACYHLSWGFPPRPQDLAWSMAGQSLAFDPTLPLAPETELQVKVLPLSS